MPARVTLPPSERLFLDVKSVAGLLSISQTCVYGLIDAGRLRSVELAGRRLVPRQAVDDLAAELIHDAEEADRQARAAIRRRARR